MLLESARFGRIEVSDDRVIKIPKGLHGFPEHTEFLLHESARTTRICWLQSIRNPDLAFPVMDGTLFGPDYPQPNAVALAVSERLPMDLQKGANIAILVVVVARPFEPRICANLLAPLIICIDSMTGFQAILDSKDYESMHVVPMELLAEPDELLRADNNLGLSQAG